MKSKHIDFNSRTHVECDQQCGTQIIDGGEFQLTHSRGVRPQNGLYVPGYTNFNSRTHVECDYLLTEDDASPEFQLTHSRGVRQVYYANLPPEKNFNSRTHVECDRRFANKQTGERDFNSRTHVECDMFNLECQPHGKISTHALTWSATLFPAVPKVARSYFNSRTHVECDILALGAEAYENDFNSRTHVECDFTSFPFF